MLSQYSTQLSYIVYALLFFSLGSLATHTLSPEIIEEDVEIHRGSSTKNNLTSPLLDFTNKSSSEPEILELKKKIEKEIFKHQQTQQAHQISYFYRNLNNGRWTGVNEDLPYRLASLSKVAVMMTFYKLAEENPDLLNIKITYHGEHRNLDNLPPALNLAYEAEYTLTELVERMIIYSDNISRSLLLDYIFKNYSLEEIATLDNDVLLITPISNNQAGDWPETTTKNFASMFRVLYNATYLSDKYSELALQTLAQSTFDAGITNGVPENTVVANKFGYAGKNFKDSTEQFHDCGVVYSSSHPYIICIMTRTQNQYTAQRIISSLSEITYNHFNEPFKKQSAFSFHESLD